MTRGDGVPGHQEIEPLRLGRWIALAVVAAAVLVFVGQNREDANVQFLWMEGQVALWLVVAGAVAMGVVIGLLAGRRRARRRR